MADMGVAPYWETTFDAQGDPDPSERDALLGGAAAAGLTDLVVFAHGWNNSRSTATGLYRSFFAPFPGLLAGAPGPVHLGYGGVIWPSMRFTDEPVPDFPPSRPALTAAGPELGPDTLRALAGVFPGSEALLDRLAELIERRPPDDARLEEFAGLVRTLVAHGRPEGTSTAPTAADIQDMDDVDAADPAMLVRPAPEVCGRFADALTAAGAVPAELFGDVWQRLWSGALELLRQASYWEMKRRAGTVGRAGLGPLLAALAACAPGLRVHLVGHSFGGRLVSFAARTLTERGGCVHSLTMLQGAFSHYAFTPRLPFATGRAGALEGTPERVQGPVVCCHSRYDQALGMLYPLASRVADDPDSLAWLDDSRWGAMGHDGIQAVDGCARLTLDSALGGALPGAGCVNVDCSSVVRRGGPPSGAHSDICHPELARLILLAGRILH